MKSSKPWDASDSILRMLTESEFYDFEIDTDSFLNFNEIFNVRPQSHRASLISNPWQENIIQLNTKIMSTSFNEFEQRIDSYSTTFLQKVEQEEKYFSELFKDVMKVNSPIFGSITSSSSTSKESTQNCSTTSNSSTAEDLSDSKKRKGYNLRSQSKQEPEPSKKRKTMVDADETESSSSDEEDKTFDPSDSDVASKQKKSSCKDSTSGKKRRKRTTYKKEDIALLKNFLLTHPDNPYPNEQEKQELVQQVDMTKEQLETWFVNHRKRYVNIDTKRKPHYAGPKSVFNCELEKKLKQEKKN